MRYLRIFLYSVFLLIVLIHQSAFAQHVEPVLFDSPSQNGGLEGTKGAEVIRAPIGSIQNIQGTPSVVVDRGKSSNRVDIVFLGDGYLNTELSEFANQVREFSSSLISQEPFVEYQEYFNVHRIDAASAQSGVDNDPSIGTLKNTILDSQFWCQGTQTTLCTDVTKTWNIASLARDFDQIVVLVNSSSVGSASYPFSDVSVLSSKQAQKADILFHLLGHSFGNLADEYDSGSWPTYTGFEPGEPNVSAQNAAAMSFQSIKWVKWLGASMFGSNIDTFEGAMGFKKGIYRPTLTSKMRELQKPFNAPSVESLIKEMYRHVRPIDDATSPVLQGQGTYTGQNTFFVKPMKTQSDFLKVQWAIDGKDIPGAVTTTFRPNNYPLTSGTRTVSVKVVDTTPWIRDENFRAKSMTEQRSWNVLIDQRLPIISQHPRSVNRFPGESAEFSVVALGDDLKYQWFRNGTSIPNAAGTSIRVLPLERSHDQDEYWVVVSNVTGSVRSNSAKITIGNRAPTYSGPNSIQTFRGVQTGFSFSLGDLDRDTLSVSAELDSIGKSSGADVSVNSSQLDLKTGAGFLGTYSLDIIIKDTQTEIRVPVRVSVVNRPPSLDTIPNQTINWGSDFITVDLSASDLDPMDSLVYSGRLERGETAPVAISIVEGNKLKIDPQANYVGQFVVSAGVTDGIATVSRSFVITWSNSAPTIAPISPQRMFYKNDRIRVPISASDPNNDALAFSARVIQGGNISLSFNGSELDIDPPSAVITTSQIEVTAFDGKLSTAQRFNFETYNSAPVINPIPEQRVSLNKKQLLVPIQVSDPDGEEVTTSAQVVDASGQQIKAQATNSEVKIISQNSFSRNFSVTVSVSDGNKNSTTTFPVIINNIAPELAQIEDQFIHPKKEDVRMVTLSASDADEDELVYKVSHLNKKNADIATLEISGNILKINLVDMYLGSFPILVEVSDGTISDTQVVHITTYNNEPKISPICDRAIDSGVTKVPLRATDIDNELITYDVRIEASALARELDEKYNFSPVLGPDSFNLFGLNEKYLRATIKNVPQTLVFITPDNKLYVAAESFEKSTFLEEVNTIFYQNPTLLIDASSNTEPQISARVKDGVLQLIASENFKGVAIVRVRAHDGFTFDEESFLVGTLQEGTVIDTISDIRSHWREDKVEIELPILSKGTSSNVSVGFYQDEKALSLDRVFQFSYLMSDMPNPISEAERPQANKDGMQEQYFIGLDTKTESDGKVTATPIVYSITPNGTIRRYVREIHGSADMYRLSKSTILDKVHPIYYRHMRLLLEPPSKNEPNINVSLRNNILTIDAADGFIGKAILEISSSQRYAGTQLILFDRYNTLPSHSPVVGGTYSYRTRQIVIPLSVSDEDALDKSHLSKEPFIEIVEYSRFDPYNLEPDVPVAKRYNEDGWREIKLTGVYNNQKTQFAILPTGALYADWNGSPESSTLVRYADHQAYLDSSLLDGRNWVGDYTQESPLKDTKVEVVNNNIVISLPSGYKQQSGSFRLQARVFDGLSIAGASDRFILWNDQTVTQPIPKIAMHWRESTRQIGLDTTDKDGLEDIKPELRIISVPPLNGSPGRLSVQGTPFLLQLGVLSGAARIFDFSIRAEDQLGAGSTRDVQLEMYNNLPTLEVNSYPIYSHTASSNVETAAVSDPDSLDSPNVKIFAINGTVTDIVGSLIQQYKLKNNSQIPYNIAGSFEQHLTGELNGKPQEFILLKNGALYVWNGSFDPELLVGFLPATAWGNFSIFADAKPKAVSLAKVRVDKNAITFERNGAPVSEPQTFTVIATDGLDFVSKPVYVTWRDNPPVLPAAATLTGHWRDGSLSLDGFPSTDIDGDQISYTLTSSLNDGYTQRIIDGKLIVTPKVNTARTHRVTVTARSTSLAAVQTYTFQFTNGNPVFQDSETFTVGYKEKVQFTPRLIDPNQDPLTLTATLLGENAGGYRVSVSGNSILVDPVSPKAGVVTVRVLASDTIGSASNEYKISYINRPPAFTAVPNMSMKWAEKTKSATIAATDPDNDPIRFTAIGDSSIALSTIENNSLIVSLLRYAPSTDIKITASDGTNRVEAITTVMISNLPPSLSGLPQTHQVHWRTDRVSLPVVSSDVDGDGITLDARVIDTQVSALASIVGNVFTIDLPNKKPGLSNFEVGATDGVVRVTSKVRLDVLNTAPKIGELTSVYFNDTLSTQTIDTESSDADGDPLILTATVLQEREVGLDLDRTYNFFVGSQNFNFNRLGNAEKYLKGRMPRETSDSDFVIYPNGRMYKWTGRLSTSLYLGTIPPIYYQDPSLLVNAVAVSATLADITANVDGTRVVLQAKNNFSGAVWVKATVTDTHADASVYFSVIKNPISGVDDGTCEINGEEYEGEFIPNGNSLFVAEGRIGDSSTGAGNRTFELDVSASTSGPFLSGETSNYVWQNNKKNNFSITYDPDTKYANFTVEGTSVRHKVTSDIKPTDLIIRIRRANIESSISISDLKINGKATNYTVFTNTNSSQVKTLRIRSINDLKQKFTIEGSALMGYASGVKNSELAFQISFVAMSDAPTNCGENGEDEDDGDTGEGEDGGNSKKVTICHIPAGDMSKAKTLQISKSALEAHLAHGDIIGACPGQPQDPGDPSTGGPTCEHKKVITSPNYTFWNSFLNMMNILELVNGTSKDIVVKVSFYSISGTLFDQRHINVPANNQFDLIVNDLNNFIKDSYGIIKLEFEGNLDGRMAFYRPSADNTGYDYAFTVPLVDATFGTTAVSFNTYQPSFKPEEVNNQVANWLSIVNLDSELRTFTVLTYDTPGRLIMRREVDVPSFGRMDIDGGHGIVGPNVVGYHKIIPKHVTSEYIVQLTRYGGNSPAGFAPSQFKFAVPLSSKLGQSDPQYMPISNKFGESNWIEVINILDKSVGASINYYSSSGVLLESVDAFLDANSQLHFEASRRLPANEVGYAVVVPFEPFSIVAQSMGYLRDRSAGSVTAVYGTQSRRIVPCMQAGSYNLYLNMQNYVLVANPTNDIVEATVSFSTPTSIVEKNITLMPKAATQIPVHGNQELRTKPDTYGLISVYPKDPSIRLFSEVLRLRYRANGNPDFAMSVPIR